MHCALQSRQMELHYLRKLSESIIPVILPPNSLQCRYVVAITFLFSPKYTEYTLVSNPLNSLLFNLFLRFSVLL